MNHIRRKEAQITSLHYLSFGIWEGHIQSVANKSAFSEDMSDEQ